MKSTLSLLALTAVAAIPAFAACGSNDKGANAPQPSASTAYNTPPPGGYPPGNPPPGGYPPAGTAPPPAGYPPAGTAPPPAGTAPPPAASGGLPANPLDPALLAQIAAAGAAMMGGGTVALGDPTDLVMKALAAKNAPGMQPEGAAAKDTLTADAHKGNLITMTGGKCYTIIAFSPPGQITNVDLHLLLPPFYNMEAGHDSEADNTAVIGKGTAAICPALQFPVQYKLDVHARAGQGAFAVQVYSKNK